MRAKDYDALLASWSLLNEKVMGMPEAEVQELLDHELAHRARLRVMLRIYNRLSKLRGSREKLNLAKKARA